MINYLWKKQRTDFSIMKTGGIFGRLLISDVVYVRKIEGGRSHAIPVEAALELPAPISWQTAGCLARVALSYTSRW